ncbi:MAG: hypothetical protein BRC26_01645 [Nanohaloarchaea archaeon QH_8_44_6]|nr:MAG: hypothetical protein BRC26_01645 [Nanohaloarchaea archaeon QH_8_44_6]
MELNGDMDFGEAIAKSLLAGIIITTSFASVLSIAYFLTSFNVLKLVFLQNLNFMFVMFTLLVVFNLTFSFNILKHVKIECYS